MLPALGALLRAYPAISRIVNGIGMVSEVANKASGSLRNLEGIAKSTAKAVGGKWVEMNDIAFKTARTMAMSREQAIRYNEQLIASTRELAAQYGVSAKELAKFQNSYSESIGRNVVLTREQLSHMSVLSKIIDETTAATLVDEFDKIGLSIKSTLVNVGHFEEKAKALGINATKASKALASNIKLASSYSFKNGVADIEKMTLKSVALRANMESIMTASDKFSTIEGALETSAKLQVLGGDIGAFGANPIANLHDSLADPANFANRLAETAKSLVSYDSKTGEATLSPYGRLRADAMASALNMSKSELVKIGQAGVIDDAIKRQVGNRGFTDEQMSAIQSLARGNFDQETGKYKIAWLDENGEHEKNVDEISVAELKIAQNSQATEENMSLDVQKIRVILERLHGRIRDTKSMKETTEGTKSWWDSLVASVQGFLGMKKISDTQKAITDNFGKQYYANGGVVEPVHAEFGTLVPGDSYSGDKVHAMVNSGEMILNPVQQKSMFNLINTLALTGGVGKLGSRMGVKGFGTTALMASALGGGDPSIGDFVEAYFMKKVIKNMIRIRKNVTEMGKATELATKSTNLFKLNWRELTRTLSSDWASLLKFMSGAWRRFAGNVLSSVKPFFTTGRLGKFTRGVKNAAKKAGKAVKGASTVIWDETSKRTKSTGNYIYNKTIAPLKSTINEKWNAFKATPFGAKASKLYKRTTTDAKILKALGKDWISRKTEGIRGRFGNLRRQAYYFNKDVIQPKTKQYKQLFRNLFNDGSKAQASKIASRYGKLGTPEIAMTGRKTNVAKEVSNVAKAAGKGGKIMSGLVKASNFAGKIFRPLAVIATAAGIASDVSDASDKYDEKVDAIEKSGMSMKDQARAKDKATKEKNKAIGGSVGKGAGALAGGIAGAKAGAAMGAAIGSIVPGAGTAIGSVLGGLIGGLGGAWLGDKLGEETGKATGGLFGGDEEKKFKEEQERRRNAVNENKPVKKSTSSNKPVKNAKIKYNDKYLKLLSSIDKKMSIIINKKIGVKNNKLASPKLKKVSNKTIGTIVGTSIGASLAPALGPLTPIGMAIGGMIGSKASKISANGIGKTIGSKISNLTKPLPISGNFMKVSPTKDAKSKEKNTVNIGKTDINLNLNGTIKLEGGGKSVDFDLAKLIDTPDFKRQLVDIITKRLNESSNCGKRNLESQRNNMASQYNNSGK